MTTRKPHPFWTVEGLRAASGGQVLGSAEPSETTIEGISIDSRTIKNGEAYFVIQGEQHDGSDFVDAAIKAGAALIIGPPSIGERTVPVIAVEDAQVALARLAATWRDCLRSTSVIGVTGTNGKTTTVNLIQAACSMTLTGSVNERSFNNHIGVPITLLRAHETDDYLVCEIGTSAPGEIATLASIVRPDIGVITSIGFGHVEHLVDLDGVRVEKGALLRVLEPEGVAIIPAGEQELLAYVEAETVITFGSAIDADVIAGPATVVPILQIDGDDRTESVGITFTINGDREFSIPLLGSHNARNAAAAIAVAEQLGVSQVNAAQGLANATVPGMRLQIKSLAGIRIINDAYNANPDSMIAAIDAAVSVPRTGRLVLILGDMLELGVHTEHEHRRIGRVISGLETPTSIVTFGPSAQWIADECEGALMVESVTIIPELTDDAIEQATGLLSTGDTVLLKASRGIKLERIADRLINLELDPTAIHHTGSSGGKTG